MLAIKTKYNLPAEIININRSMLAIKTKYNLPAEIIDIIYEYDSRKKYKYDKVIAQLNNGCHYIEGWTYVMKRHWLSPMDDLVYITVVQDLYRPQSILLNIKQLDDNNNKPYINNDMIHLSNDFNIALTDPYILRVTFTHPAAIHYQQHYYPNAENVLTIDYFIGAIYPLGSLSAGT